MKKSLLMKSMLLLCALMIGSSVWAVDPDLTLNFTSAWTAGADNSDGEKVFTSGGYTISGKGTNFKFNSGYFYLGKNNAYIKLPKVNFDVEKIEVVGNFGASRSVVHNIFVGDVAVSNSVTGLNNTTSTFEIGSSYQVANTQYILKITSNHNAQVTYIKYYKKSSDTPTSVATPAFSVGTGTYTTAQSVTITCATDDATIYYTINGAEPTESDETYSSAISITSSGTVLKAKAFKAGMSASSVASATYTIKPTTPTISAAGSTITITGADGCNFYYTTDNSAPSKANTEYTAPFEQSTDCTIKAIAYDTYNNSSSTVSFKFKYMPLDPKNINTNYYEKVTDVNTLENGDAILIVCEADKFAMSTTQNTNNRGQAGVTMTGDVIYAPTTNVQRLILVKKTEKISSVDTDVFYFYTGSGYLYAASSSSNHLKTEVTPDDNNNARATIAISNGDATITFKGTSTRNWLKHNSENTIFSCYSSSDVNQDIVQIYKEVAHNESISISDAGLATFASDVALDFSGVTGVEAYIAKESVGDIMLTKVNKVPANTGVLLRSTVGSVTKDVPVATSTDNVTGNIFVRGNDAAVATGDGPYNWILSKKSGVVGFYHANGNNVAKNRAYLQTAAAEARINLNFDDEDVTAIEAVKTQNVQNGQYFNLAGQRVAQPTKGLYFVNGKKVIIK